MDGLLFLRNNLNIIAMSIYSGFATRFQEEAYDNCIDSLLYILQKRIIKFYQGDTADEEKFVSLVLKLHQQMRNMEKNKYLEPKSSHSVNQLIKYMNNSQRNTVPNGNSNVQSKQSEPAEVIEPKPSLPDITNEKKKNTLWVQRRAAEAESNKTQTEQEVQTMGTINKNVNGHGNSTEDKMEFRRTTYQPRNIRALNVKNASRSKLSGEKREERYIGLEDKELKKRAMSNNIHSKPVIHFKEIHEDGQESHRMHKRKIRSISRVNQAEAGSGEGQVADIIKDYIVKVKKGYLRGHRSRDIKEGMAKVHDF